MNSFQTNSTFLPVLDDLLSPDFRQVLLPIQTPTDPTPTSDNKPSFSQSITQQQHQLNQNQTNINNNYNFASKNSHNNNITNLQKEKSLNRTFDVIAEEDKNISISSSKSSRKSCDEKENEKNRDQDQNESAVKIQQWWKVKKHQRNVKGDQNCDVKAERARHSIRHARTEEHIRFLESEVGRLKSALTCERRLRSLQVEAIRSLWTQVQKLSIAPNVHNHNESLMSQSVPNGLPEENTSGATSNMMTMSLHSGLQNPTRPILQQQGSLSSSNCSCSSEIQVLRQSLTGEMSQLRGMIDALKNGSPTYKKEVAGTGLYYGGGGGGDADCLKTNRRPFSLDLPSKNIIAGDKTKTTPTGGAGGDAGGNEKKEVLKDYANEMASKLLENVEGETVKGKVKSKYFPPC